jgi:hypothetical protein
MPEKDRSRGGTIYVYRGVHAEHPRLEEARRRYVIPGNVAGTITPQQHNDEEFLEDSPFTSWTYSIGIAMKRAYDRGSGGLVLQLPLHPPGHEDSWEWVTSPDRYDEDEILLKGIRMDAEVVEDDGSPNSFE